MKLVTMRTAAGARHAGVLREDHVIDLAEFTPSTGPMPNFDMVDLIDRFDRWRPIVEEALASETRTLRNQCAWHPLDQVRLLAPIPRPRKNIMCMGRNYLEHAAESLRTSGEKIPGGERPEWPAIFTKAPTAVIGPYDDIPIDPRVSERIDWEAELAVVIGRLGKNFPREQALDYVFGYMVLNDISARDIQHRHGNQYFKGKSLDASCPMGPYLVTADEIGDPSNLELWTLVNGVEKQRDNTGSMMWDVPTVIEIMSMGMTLEPGDIIATGTPGGVGNARDPKEFIRPGDIVEAGVEKIGVLRNHAVLAGE